MGHLINTLASGLHLGTLRINAFSGEATPGKTEVSFEQWQHKVQCLKDHYLESVVQESIVRSLKGAVADMARYMGPTASVSNILQKLMVIFGMVALFNVLMQNFYKVTQGNHEKVPSFATRLQGTLNQIQLKCPRQIADCKVSWHLKDCLFHGVCKYIRDSVRYLFSNPKMTYLQLIVVAHKAESDMEEVKDKVRARSAVNHRGGWWVKRAEQPNCKVMAAQTRAVQGNCPAGAPNSPRHRGHGTGWTDRNTPTCPNSHNGWTGLGQTTFAHSFSASSRVCTVPQGKGNNQRPSDDPGSVQNMKDPSLLQCFRCQGWGHIARDCTTPTKMLNRDGKNWGNVAKPPTSSSQEYIYIILSLTPN